MQHKKKCTTKFVSSSTNIKILKAKKKNPDTSFRNRHPTLVEMFRSPDRSFRMRYTNYTGISLFYNAAVMPCVSFIFTFPLERNSTSTFLLTYFSYVQNSRQHCVLKHPQIRFFTLHDRPCFTSTLHSRWNLNHVH